MDASGLHGLRLTISASEPKKSVFARGFVVWLLALFRAGRWSFLNACFGSFLNACFGSFLNAVLLKCL